jgi:3',5'-cyclic AMP phosphodiesterase CpdA
MSSKDRHVRPARRHPRMETAILATSALVGVLAALLAIGSGPLSQREPGTSFDGEPSSSPETPQFFVGAGDIADCSSRADSLTAELIAGTAAPVFTLGDNVVSGAEDEYRICYDETWGAALGRTYPVIGNHDLSGGGAAYFDYFGSRAGEEGYYSFDLGAWHVIVLNSQCEAVGGCEAESRQGRWLAEDLAAHPAPCTLALWHIPLSASSGNVHGDDLLPFWEVLYAAGAELVVNGHAHTYERFAPQNPRLLADPEFGIRQIIAGTGGHPLLQLGERLPNSEVQGRAHGVLVLELHADRYAWEFVPVRGQSFRDQGGTPCHGAPVADG